MEESLVTCPREGCDAAVPRSEVDAHEAACAKARETSPADLQRAERLNMLPFPPTISKCRVKRIAFTGGPCSGKTVALSMVAERLRSTGLQVFVCPEATPLMEAAGVSFEHRKGTEQEPSQEAHRRVWLKNTMEMQMTTESALIRIAEASERTCVILFDRGVQDLGISVDDRCWNAVVESLGETVASLNARYDAVFHLRTTAQGAVGHFKAGMLPHLAVELDARHQHRWRRHPQFTVIENPAKGGMAEKAQQAMSGVCHHVGVRSPTCLCKQMFLCSSSLAEDMSQDWLQEFVDEFRVEITFLEGSKVETNTFLRHRLRRNTEQTFSEADSYTKCSCKWKEDQSGGPRQQTTEEFLITQKEYHNLRSQRADPHCETLVVWRGFEARWEREEARCLMEGGISLRVFGGEREGGGGCGLWWR